MSESSKRSSGTGFLELIGLTTVAFVLANVLMVRIAFKDASWGALAIQVVFGPSVNVLIGACAIAIQHWGVGRTLSVRSGRVFKVAVACAILIAIKVDFSLIEAVPKHGC